MKPKQHIHFSNDELNTFIKIATIVAVSVLALFLLTLTINQVRAYSTIGDAAQAGISPNTITVNGSADMDIQPDLTTFSWSLDASGKTVQESQDKVATVANKAIAYLKEQGIAEADIKTTGFYTNTHYENKVVPCTLQTSKTVSRSVTSAKATSAVAPASSVSSAPTNTIEVVPVIVGPCGSQSVPAGYDTSESVTVKVRNIDKDPSKAGQLIAGLGTIGVKVSGPENSIDNPDVYKEAVRGQAIIKARQQAQVLASQLGVRLGKISNFSENEYPSPIAYGGMAARDASTESKAVTPDLPTGTNKVSSEVSVTYEIR